MPSRTRDTAPNRMPWLDALRGLAVVGMVVFHAGWDMADQNLVGRGAGVGPGWQTFGNVVAALFLAVSGFSLVLARRRGTPTRIMLRRIGLVLAVAMGLTLGTFVFARDAVIYFGILHCIAVGDLLVLPLLEAPLVLCIALGATVLAAPTLAAGSWTETPLLVWLGLPGRVPLTLDYRPLLPWAGFILVGVVAARSWPGFWEALPAMGGRVGRSLRMIGRHSLVIYILHQAVLFPVVYLVAQGVGARPPNWLDAFETRCRADCLGTGASTTICETTCTCARDEVERSPLGAALQTRKATLEDHNELGRIAGLCLRRAKP